MRSVVEALAHVSVLLGSVMPGTAQRIHAQLARTPPDNFTLNELKCGILPDGHMLKEPQPLFPIVLPAA